jgi:hypothetical protein
VLIALLSKVIPRIKPESVAIENNISGRSPTEQATAIVSSALSGNLAPSIASELLQSLACAVKVREADELLSRIERLEDSFYAQN